MHAWFGFGTDLAATTALPVAARGAAAAHTAADHGAAAAIATAFAVDAGLVLLAAIIMGRVTVLAANALGGAAELRAGNWIEPDRICQRKGVLAAFARPHRRARLAPAALLAAPRAGATLATAALSASGLAPGGDHLPFPGEAEQERRTARDYNTSRCE